VDKGAIVVDVGSDHAQVPIYLLRTGVIAHAQAIENKKGPFLIMEKAIRKSGQSEKCAATMCDGLENVDPSADTAILAGMGGELIVSILEKDLTRLNGLKTIIVDSHTDLPFVRERIARLGYRMTDELFFFDAGKPYDIMKWTKSEEKADYSEKELYFGPINLQKKTPDWMQAQKNRLVLLNRILESKIIASEDRQKMEHERFLIEETLED
jgi:tRNA (adenine22-N1)-methyltransferase